MRTALALLALLGSCTTVDSLTGEARGRFRAVYGHAAAKASDLGVDQAGGTLSYAVDADNTLLADLDLSGTRGSNVGLGIGLRERFRVDTNLQPHVGAGLTASSNTSDVDVTFGGYGALGIEAVHGKARFGLEYRYYSEFGDFEDEGLVLLRIGVQY